MASDNEDPTLQKIANVLGPAKARALTLELLAEIRRSTLETADDRLAFGEALVKRGGLLAALGRSIRIQAFLLGAKDPEAR